jgi:hypothetical protein
MFYWLWSMCQMAKVDSHSGNTTIGLAGETLLDAKELRDYAADARRAERAKSRAAKSAAKKEMEKAEQDRIKALMFPLEMDQKRIANFMLRVRQAAERGDHHILVLRFPSAMCSDSGRAINNALPGWENTLVGVPEQILHIWQEHLKPLGFHLSAEVLETPDGMPGDIGLFCRW